MIPAGYKARPRRQNLATGLFVVQLSLAFIALVVCWFNVESIIVTGPLLVLVGLALAVAVRPLGTWTPLFLGLSGPLVSALIAFLIAAFRLQPQQAEWPVFTIFAIYLVLIVPISVVTFGQIRAWDARLSRSRAWRYSIRSLLGLMTVV